MRRPGVRVGVVLCVLAVTALGGPSGGSTVRAAAQTRPAQGPFIPKFQVDPAWPTIPNGWVLGMVASVAVDAQDHVWVLQRPRTLGADETGRAAPPVLEFDAAGRYVQGWGGAGEGYNWPESEHGIFVDHKGFVWIGGQGPTDQILKFTKAGRFVMRIGQPGKSTGNRDTQNLGEPADVWVHPKTNELFVADGYGNRRVIVFDADTGRYKRMWGAFGNAPTDGPPATDTGALGPTQFVQPVHAARVSNDGLVYVSDRGGRRVQVFTVAGKYVTQVFIGRECVAPACGNGTTAAATAFSPDAEQRYLYVANRSQAQVMVLDRRTLKVLDTFGQWGSAPGEFGTLHHMAVDSKGNLYVAEVTPLQPQNRRVQKFAFVGMASAQSADPFVGTWKLNLEKSRFPGEPPARPYVLSFEQTADGSFVGIVFDLDGRDRRTAVGRITYRYDGQDNQDQDLEKGAPATNSLAFTQIDRRTVDVVHKLNQGKSVYRERRSVSEDGRTMTFVMTVSDLQGPVSVIQVFDRE